MSEHILGMPIADQLKAYDAWGSSGTYPHMASLPFHCRRFGPWGIEKHPLPLLKLKPTHTAVLTALYFSRMNGFMSRKHDALRSDSQLTLSRTTSVALLSSLSPRKTGRKTKKLPKCHVMTNTPTKRPIDDGLSALEQVSSWLFSLGIRIEKNRLSTYRRAFRTIDAHIRAGTLQKIRSALSPIEEIGRG